MIKYYFLLIYLIPGFILCGIFMWNKFKNDSSKKYNPLEGTIKFLIGALTVILLWWIVIIVRYSSYLKLKKLLKGKVKPFYIFLLSNQVN